MFQIIPSDESFQTAVVTDSGDSAIGDLGEFNWYGFEDEQELEELVPEKIPSKYCISVGDSLPYGPRLFFENNETIVRMKDIGQKHRILVLGVIGSFTPYCWNRHLYRVINKTRYYEERGIDYICCIATNDVFTHTAWSAHLGCENSVFMLADTTKRFTKALGMDIVIPWLDNNVRSKRYIIYAENMVVTKMIVAPNDGPNLRWNCEHIQSEESVEEEDRSEEEEEEDDARLWT